MQRCLAGATMSNVPSGDGSKYDVCLSFAGEQRDYVAAVAEKLRSDGVKVFYDEYEKAALWGKDLYEHLAWVYGKAARYCIVFVSIDYARKVWTTHERRSAQERALNENREYVLPVRFDDTELPGLRSTIAYLHTDDVGPGELAKYTVEKLGPIHRRNYLPPDLAPLVEAMGLPAEDLEYVDSVAHSFLSTLYRMSVEERRLVAEICREGCPTELPENMHVSLDLVRRAIGVPPVEAIALLKGMKSLGFESTLRDDPDGEGDDLVVLSWHDRTSRPDDVAAEDFAFEYSTLVAEKMLTVAMGDYCVECGERVLVDLDFSNLAA